LRFPQAPVTDAPSASNTGRITKLLHGRLCGFIKMNDGREVFFHARDLEGTTYGEMRESGSVRFHLIDDAISGPRASRVSAVRPRR
jgi:cold shock CspA family protein